MATKPQKKREQAHKCEVEDCGTPAVMKDEDGHWRCDEHAIAPLYVYAPVRETR